jgi:hypothetical protein
MPISKRNQVRSKAASLTTARPDLAAWDLSKV